MPDRGLRPRTLRRSGARWTPRATRPVRGIVSRLGRWHPRLGLGVVIRPGRGPSRRLVRRPQPVRLIRPATLQVERYTRENRLATVVVRSAPRETTRPAMPEMRSAPRIRAAVRPTRPAPRFGTGFVGLPSPVGPSPAGPSPARHKPVPGRAEQAGAFPERTGRPVATPREHTRERIVVAAPAVRRPAVAPSGAPRQPADRAAISVAPQPAAPPPLTPPSPPGLDELVDRVLRRIERRAIAQRERLGRV